MLGDTSDLEQSWKPGMRRSHYRFLRLGLVFICGKDIGGRSWDRPATCKGVGHLGRPAACHKYRVHHKSVSDLMGVSALAAGTSPVELRGETDCGSLQSSLPCRLGRGGMEASFDTTTCTQLPSRHLAGLPRSLAGRTMAVEHSLWEGHTATQLKPLVL